MPYDPTPFLVYQLNQNTMAINSAIEEIAAWIRRNGDPGAACVISSHLSMLERNAAVISRELEAWIPTWHPTELKDD